MKYEYFIGLRYLRAKRRQTFVSVITAIAVAGVAVGVAALIIVTAGMVGVQEYMRDKILGFNAHITVVNIAEDRISDADALAAKVARVPHVTGAIPFIQGQLMIRGKSANAGIMVRGIDPARAGVVMNLEGDSIIRQGSLRELNPDFKPNLTVGRDLPTIALGLDLADEIGVTYGDEVTLIIMDGTLMPGGAWPKPKRFRVGCIFKFGFYEVDSKVALVSFTTASDLFKTEGRADGIEVKTDNIYNVDDIVGNVTEVLGPGLYAQTWQKAQAQLFAALKMEQFLSVIFLSLIMVVASLNIISMLLMLVMEKYSDIAILKSMGASDGGIMRIFITQGTVIGVIGAALGVILGLSLCILQIVHPILKLNEAVYQFSVVPMKITALNVIGVAVGAMVISFLTTLYPSWQAARMKPAESLRYE
jgi:lipoprotein-releasing system permease protein